MESSGGGTKREDAYKAWKDRLNSRKSAEQAAYEPEPEEEPEEEGSGYWSAESLYRDSALEVEREQREADEARQRSARANELLAQLGLAADSTLEQVSARYKQLAKELHPDRHPSGSPNGNKAAIELVEASAAYGELKGLLS